MRFSLLLASSALAASLVLSACSTSGGSQAIPGGTQTSMGRHAGPQILALGAKRDTSCPSVFYECFEISKASPASQEWCIVYSGTSDCTDLYPGTWTWSSKMAKYKKGKIKGKNKKCKESFSPNPGNPTTLEVTTTQKKSSKGKIYCVDELSVENSSGSGLGPIYIGITID